MLSSPALTINRNSLPRCIFSAVSLSYVRQNMAEYYHAKNRKSRVEIIPDIRHPSHNKHFGKPSQA